jgi:hypothetical protein
VPSAVPSPTEALLPSMCKWRQFLLQRIAKNRKDGLEESRYQLDGLQEMELKS